jgi:hypothetical protein
MPTRRRFFSSLVLGPIVLPKLGRAAGASEQHALTPTCADDVDLTPSQHIALRLLVPAAGRCGFFQRNNRGAFAVDLYFGIVIRILTSKSLCYWGDGIAAELD